jgi:long-subunit fatty acid transport protein
MKRKLTFIALLACAISSAQNISDVLRYSSENIQGTARFQGMSGSFGALGGDLSSLNTNPAGAAIFNNNQGSVTAALFNRNNTITYGGSQTDISRSYAEISQAGGVLVFKSTNPETGWGKFALALNYDIAENFDNEIFAAGSANEGIDNYFLNFAQGVPFGDILLQDGEFLEDAYLDIGSNFGFGDQQTFLGYFGGLIDPATADNDNTAYVSNADYNTVNQEFSRISTGYNSKFTVNAATQYREKFNFGASLNFHTILQTKNDEFTETGYNATSEIQRTTFDNYLLTEGSGFSFSLGAIAKVTDFVRLGASYQSPTWYRIEDALSQRITSDLADEDINFINYDIVNIFPRYTLKTPGKLTGSMALVFGKNGLLSVDYGYQDMSQAKLGPTSDANFASVNSDVSNQLGIVNSLRIGGEYRIERFSLRGGYRFEGSPYEDGSAIGDLTGFSGGLGYDFGNSRLDLALNRSERDVAQRLFDTGINTPALVNGINTNATLSYTINF